MSQVGCRLIVASSAKISRPFAPGACGDSARALATKAATSSEVEVFACGSAPSSAFAETASLLRGLIGSLDIRGRTWSQATNVDSAPCPVNVQSLRRRIPAEALKFVSSYGRMDQLLIDQLLAGAIRATGPGSSIFGGDDVVSTGAIELSVSLRNLSSMPWIEFLASSGPVSRMSLCWKSVFTTWMPAFSHSSSVGITPGSVLNCGSLERNDRILNFPAVTKGTRRLSSVTTFLISSGYCLAKYMVMSPPMEWPTIVTLS